MKITFLHVVLKKCTKCTIVKDSSDFYKNVRTKDGLSYFCKKCVSEISLIRYNKKYNQDILTVDRKKVKLDQRRIIVNIKQNGA